MKAKSFLTAVLLIALSLPAVYPIITPGYFPIHDDTQIVRVYEMYQALSSGQFPVRWVPDLGYGYGYPIFNFYNPLPYYFGALFMFFKAGALVAAKIMMVAGTILAGITMYILMFSIFSQKWAAAAAAILYIYAPYHGVQIYVRGAVAEYWAYAILPLLFYTILKRKIVLGGLILGLLILSHNLTAFMSIPFLTLKLLLQCFETLKSKKTTGKIIAGCSLFLAIGLGVSAFFWLPAIAEAGKTQVSPMVFEKFDPPSKHLTTLKQIWTSPWGYGGSSPGTDDGLSLQLGKIHLFGSLAAIVILLHCCIVKRKLTIEQFSAKGQSAFGGNNLTIFSSIGLLFSIFLMLPYSAAVWNSIPLLSYIQFPWRFLTFASLFSSILAAWVIWKAIEVYETLVSRWKFRKLLFRSLFSVLCFLFIFSSLKFFRPRFKYPTSAAQLTSRERIFWEVSRRSDEYLPNGFIKPTVLEEALRVDHPENQALVDKIKQPNKIRLTANFISLLTFFALLVYATRWKFRKLLTG